MWPWKQRKTIDEWAVEYKLKVMDPDGFDRKDPHLNTRRFTREEWEEGLPLCTIMMSRESLFHK